MGNDNKGGTASYSGTEGSYGHELAKLRAAISEIQRIRLSAQNELELVKRIRAEAEKYRQDIETKARSQAHLIILKARLAAMKEIAGLGRATKEEIQRILADVLATAQDGLELQRRFTDAARICALSPEFQEEAEERSESEEAVGV